jgi:hypothetical protein
MTEHYQSPEELREIQVVMKLKEPTFTRGGKLYFDPKLDEWLPIERKAPHQCNHEDTFCAAYVRVWMEDYFIKLIHVPSGAEAGINDVPGIKPFSSYGG